MVIWWEIGGGRVCEYVVEKLWEACGGDVWMWHVWVAIWTLLAFVVCILVVYCYVCVGNKMLRYDLKKVNKNSPPLKGGQADGCRSLRSLFLMFL